MRKVIDKNFKFTFLYFHLCLYLMCMVIYSDFWVDFYVLEGKCRSFIEYLTFFYNTLRRSGGKRK